VDRNKNIKAGIEILAFIQMVKDAHSNSILFEDAAYKMAQKIGMSDGRTVKKYLTKCLDMGLCEKSVQSYNTNNKRTAYSFIAFSKALSLLFDLKGSQQKYFALHKNAGRFKNYQYKIELDLVSLNVAQQAYKANSNFPNKNNIMRELIELSKLSVSEKQTRAFRNRRSKLLKRYNEADQKAQESMIKGHSKDVVTGCRHIAAQIGKSSTTGNKRIKKWIDTGNISVKDVTRFTKTSSESEAALLIDTFKREKVKGIHLYSRAQKGVITHLGKKVEKFESEGWEYKI
jgi:hypothetical protein